MSYEVLARKWRPQKFDDVVGQGHVVQTLQNAIKIDRIAHAYLFVGPRGIGKTSVARIFAKALNCKNGPAVEPCCECDSCQEIASGTSMDVIEIDGASNNSVDQVRDLRETVKYAPTNSFKIYIIDEVHMLSTAAFNALLKTLEEPPPFVKFIFATTEPQKILATIISRCQRFDLRRIPVSEIVERLQMIADAENVKIEEDALLAIARGAEGGMRDAQSALDQLISFRGEHIAEEDVLSVFGLVSRGMLEEMAEQVLQGDVKALIGSVSGLDKAGKDLQRVLMELMEHFRNLLVCMNVGDDVAGLDFTEAQLDVLRGQAGKTTTARLLRVCSILSQADDKMKFALSKRTVLEMALIRSARAATVVTLEEILSKINALKDGGASLDAAPAAPLKKKVVEEPPAPAPPAAPVEQAEPPAPAAAPEPPVEIDHAEHETLLSSWPTVIDKVGKVAPLARSLLLDARPVEVTDEKIVIGFDPEFGDELENFKSDRNRKAVERVLQSMTGKKRVIDFIVSEKAAEYASSVRKTDEAESGASSGGQGEDDGEKGFSGNSMQDWIKEPGVKAVLEAFDGTIIDVRK